MQYFDLAQLSISKGFGSGATEIYIPLWMSDGTVVNNNQSTAPGVTWLLDGNNAGANKLHTLSAKWPATQAFAFEITMYSGSGVVYAGLWDWTTNSLVSASQVSTTNTSATVIRSGKFMLIPGHQYGVTVWSGGAWYGYLSDASLVVFP
jgi:hypothetical protein